MGFRDVDYLLSLSAALARGRVQPSKNTEIEFGLRLDGASMTGRQFHALDDAARQSERKLVELA
jgi:hypothetical protein